MSEGKSKLSPHRIHLFIFRDPLVQDADRLTEKKLDLGQSL